MINIVKQLLIKQRIMRKTALLEEISREVKKVHEQANNAPFVLTVSHRFDIKISDKDLEKVSETNCFVIGRDGRCDIIVEHPTISRIHCFITKQNGKFQVNDCSLNGTYIH